MTTRNAANGAFDIVNLLQTERLAFAAKVRLARAVAGLSQSELAARIGMTQRSIHKLEQGFTEPRRATVFALERLWREQGIMFEDTSGGGFRVDILSAAFEHSRRVPLQPAAPLSPVNDSGSQPMKLWPTRRSA